MAILQNYEKGVSKTKNFINEEISKIYKIYRLDKIIKLNKLNKIT